MSNIDKQALRGQSVEGSFYLVECCNCSEMYPSNLLDGGEAIADSGDYGDCYCHLCGADDTERADWGDVNSNEVKAWNFQQKRIEALLDELEDKDRRNAELEDLLFSEIRLWTQRCDAANVRREAAEKRVAELEQNHTKLRESMAAIHNTIRWDGAQTSLAVILNAAKRAHEESATAAGRINGEG